MGCRTAAWKSGIFGTFWLIGLDPDNRLRNPSVSFFFDMCWCLELARGVPENLFGMRFCKGKVGDEQQFLLNVDFRKFHEIFKLVGVQTMKNHKFSSLARMSGFAVATLGT